MDIIATEYSSSCIFDLFNCKDLIMKTTKQYKCPLCGRNKFDSDYQPHKCNGQWRKKLPKFEETIEDGFGSTWSKRCPQCGRLSMEVVRPGKVQCNYCD